MMRGEAKVEKEERSTRIRQERRKEEKGGRTSEKERNGNKLAKLEALRRAPGDEVPVDNRRERVSTRSGVELVERQPAKAVELVGGRGASGAVDDRIKGGLVLVGAGGGKECGSS
jgi:hypothetical protein